MPITQKTGSGCSKCERAPSVEEAELRWSQPDAMGMPTMLMLEILNDPKT